MPLTGTIKRLTDKGFGFITTIGDGRDFFFHASGLANRGFDDLVIGERVEFEEQYDERRGKVRAVNVVVL